MTPRIAIPIPTSLDPEYNERSMTPYLEALRAAGAEPVTVPAGLEQQEVARVLQDVHGMLLPGSRYDIDPEKYGEARIAACAPADPARAAVDELLLQDAFNLRKPILAICYGAQALNVWRNGTLYQDLETQLETPVDHRPGRGVRKAHRLQVTEETRLAAIAREGERDEWVNSSHHQALRVPGDNLRVSAISPEDSVIEGVEIDSPDHFVLGLQWHPERTYDTSSLSRAVFSAFVDAAEAWRPPRIEDSVTR